MGVFKRKNRKGTQHWYIRYSYNNHMKWESVGKVGEAKREDAIRLLALRKEEISLKGFTRTKKDIPTIQNFSNDYIAHKRDVQGKISWKRDVAALKNLLPYFGHRRLNEVSARNIDFYKEKRLKKVSAKTINVELEVLRAMFYLAEKWDLYFSKNPVKISGLIPCISEQEYVLTMDEEKRLLNSAPDYLKDIIICALNTGMRKSEVLHLRWDQVDMKRSIIILDALSTKTKKKRKIPINGFLKKTLSKIKIHNRDKVHIFLSGNGTVYKSQDSLNRIWKKTLERAKIENLRFHDLRHTAATRMAEATGNIIAVSRILGHTNIFTTMRYAHPDKSLIACTDSLESHSTTVAKTVAKDFESNCVCEDKAVFKMVAEEGFEPPTFGL